MERLQHDAVRGKGHQRLSAGTIAAVQRKVRLWVPFANKLALRSIEVDGITYTDPSEKLDALTRHWAPISAATKLFLHAQGAMLNDLFTPVSMMGLPPRLSRCFGVCLSNLRRRDPLPASMDYRALHGPPARWARRSSG
eukprot:7320840-Pyramimonas_sp.AAC.1